VKSGGPPASSARGFDLEAALRMEQGSPATRVPALRADLGWKSTLRPAPLDVGRRPPLSLLVEGGSSGGEHAGERAGGGEAAER
jgi:hypothetical protein